MWYSKVPSWVCRYLPEMDDTNNWICYPFHSLPPVHLLISEQESVIEIATSGFCENWIESEATEYTAGGWMFEAVRDYKNVWEPLTC